MDGRNEEGTHHASARRLGEFALLSEDAFEAVKSQEERDAVDQQRDQKSSSVRPEMSCLERVSLCPHVP